MKKPLLFLLLALAPVTAAPPASDELLAALQTCMETGKPIQPLLLRLSDLPAEELKNLTTALEKAWPAMLAQYQAELNKATKTLSSGSEKNKNQDRIRTLRQEFLSVYQLEKDAMKPLLKTKSMPTLEELRTLLMPDLSVLLKTSGPPLAKLRHAAQSLATFRDAVLNTDLSTISANSLTTLEAAEKKAAADISLLDSNGLRILEANAKLATKEQLPLEEVKGIEECNLWRLLVGLNACTIDTGLCNAARDHSKDMAEKRFFAHESPVPGKKGPSDRAARFGTTYSGENIYMGSAQSSSANRGWFFSPGHHKNMFSPGQTRIGLGQYGSHWTQMFGR